MRSTYFACLLLIATLYSFSFAQVGAYSSRSLLEKKVYVLVGKKIITSKFWSIPLGNFDCTIKKKYPGEGDVNVDCSMNLSLLSSAYIEGSGYGSRGKMTAEGHFAIRDGDTIRTIELSEIDYIFDGGLQVALTDQKTYPLCLKIENAVDDKTLRGRHKIRNPQIMLWKYNKVFKELKHDKDLKGVLAISFTKQGIQKAKKAQRNLQ